MPRTLKLTISVLLCQLAGLVGSFFTRTSVDIWYKILEKPFFTPPSWVFAPVWIILYFLMGISAFLIWDIGLDQPQIRNALKVFLLQLIINSSWSMVFFGMQNLLLSVIVIMLLWIVILWTMVKFHKISKTAAVILIPYFCWVSFAMILNIMFLMLN
jgi:tryptophan-rich sensory protein